MTIKARIEAFARALAAATPEKVKQWVRDDCAKRFGTCQRCGEPLGGPSPSKICTGCHADVLLERAGGNEPGDA